MKTAELIGVVYLVRIAYDETALREKIKTAGARWDYERKLWLADGAVIRRLALHDRIVGWLEPE